MPATCTLWFSEAAHENFCLTSLSSSVVTAVHCPRPSKGFVPESFFHHISYPQALFCSFDKWPVRSIPITEGSWDGAGILPGTLRPDTGPLISELRAAAAQPLSFLMAVAPCSLAGLSWVPQEVLGLMCGCVFLSPVILSPRALILIAVLVVIAIAVCLEALLSPLCTADQGLFPQLPRCGGPLMPLCCLPNT